MTASPASKKAKRGPGVQPRELDVTNAEKSVWLVKIPNYMADAWENAEPDSELGRIKVSP